MNSNKDKHLLVINDYTFQQNGKATMAASYLVCRFKHCSVVTHTTTKTKSPIAVETTVIGYIYEQEMAKANLLQMALVMAPTTAKAHE